MRRVHFIYPTHPLEKDSKYSVPRVLAFLASELHSDEIEVVVWNLKESKKDQKYLEQFVKIPHHIRLYRRFEYRFLSRVRNSHFSWWVKKIGRKLLNGSLSKDDVILCATYQAVIDLRRVGVSNRIMLWTHGFDYNNLEINIQSINLSSGVFVASQAFVDQMYSLFQIGGINVPIFRIGNPFNVEDYQDTGILKECNDQRVENISDLVYFYGGGTLDRKGFQIIQYLIKEWRPQKSVVLTIAGHGIVHPKIEKYGNLTVSYKPFLNASELKTELSNSDVFLLPSLWFENFPLLLFEALYFGLIPVISSFGGGKEMFDNELGYLINYPNFTFEWLECFSCIEKLEKDEILRRKKLLSQQFLSNPRNETVVKAFKDFVLS